MTQFSDFIDGHLLIDLPLQGATFTWSSGRESVTLSRLDRFLISGDWEEKFPDVTQAALVRVTSDHVPLVLDCGGMRSRRTPFCFENMWLRAEDFQGKVQSWWEEAVFTGSNSYVLAKKFQILKSELKKASHGISTLSKSVLLGDFAEIATMEEISWRQKSRALWLKEGGCNTKFFHRLANAHRRYNNIGRIRVNGLELRKEDEVRGGIVSFYQQLYTETLEWRPKLDGLHFDAISTLDSDMLEIPFSEEEVLKALSSCYGDKAPGQTNSLCGF
ncbi:uncharacterized protein LOC132305222 [Cornus florida]|uniref:uncharacterized protein LOC132305222 n=1 Tax=Cornus florida TaxID=4283 RepID=UPI00289B6940|nr:uncharacterized protein LOC132305222 [Cornus florida]